MFCCCWCFSLLLFERKAEADPFASICRRAGTPKLSWTLYHFAGFSKASVSILRHLVGISHGLRCLARSHGSLSDCRQQVGSAHQPAPLLLQVLHAEVSSFGSNGPRCPGRRSRPQGRARRDPRQQCARAAAADSPRARPNRPSAAAEERKPPQAHQQQSSPAHHSKRQQLEPAANGCHGPTPQLTQAPMGSGPVLALSLTSPQI